MAYGNQWGVLMPKGVRRPLFLCLPVRGVLSRLGSSVSSQNDRKAFALSQGKVPLTAANILLNSFPRHGIA